MQSWLLIGSAKPVTRIRQCYSKALGSNSSHCHLVSQLCVKQVCFSKPANNTLPCKAVCCLSEAVSLLNCGLVVWLVEGNVVWNVGYYGQYDHQEWAMHLSACSSYNCAFYDYVKMCTILAMHKHLQLATSQPIASTQYSHSLFMVSLCGQLLNGC